MFKFYLKKKHVHCVKTLTAEFTIEPICDLNRFVLHLVICNFIDPRSACGWTANSRLLRRTGENHFIRAESCARRVSCN